MRREGPTETSDKDVGKVVSQKPSPMGGDAMSLAPFQSNPQTSSAFAGINVRKTG